MSSYTTGRMLLSSVGAFTIISPFVADWNKTHVLNPNWPPHARFHNGQTMSMGLALGCSTLYYLWAKPSTPGKVFENERLNTATLLAAMYWVTQMSAILYPGALAIDPEFGEGNPQFWLGLGIYVIIGVGYGLEKRRIEGAKVRV